MMSLRRLFALLTLLTVLGPSFGGDPAAWTLLDKAVIGPMRPASLVYIPTDNRWMTLGYYHSPGTGPRKPRTYDDLSFDTKSGQWENWYPEGKDWGPRFGDCTPPGFKGEKNFFKDIEGNARPHWSAWYWLLGNGHNYAWDPDSKSVLFFIDGQTFRYDPAARAWHDLKAPGDPQSASKSRTLLWGSVCYDQAHKNLVLFGGGNAMTERGDPGTWTYSLGTNTWTDVSPKTQPPARANSSLVYDPVSKKVVLFGGDRLNELLADTWVFDGKTWEQRTPKLSPAPRAGHALVWLPKSQKILLLGGYGYDSGTGYYASLYKSLPFEAWTYDLKADRWDLVHRIEPPREKGAFAGPQSPVNFSLQADVDADENILLVDGRRQTWKYAGAFKADESVTTKHGVAPGTTVRRSGPYDPKWYDDVPPADPAKVEADLKDLPANRWILRPTPKLPRPNTDWGSAVYATHSGKIIRFSGGHSAYSGTAPHVYDTKTDRWSLPFAPEFPIHISYSNDGVPGDWSFAGNPWMTGHTYKALGYDPNLKALVFGPHKYSYFFEPDGTRWTRSREPNPYQPNFYTTTLIPTPKGLVCWSTGKDPLWRLDADTKTWKPLPVQGKFPSPVCDNAGMAYDSKRDRLLAFVCDFGKGTTTTHAYDLAAGVATKLDPPGSDAIQPMWRDTDGKKHFEFREAVYLPEHDLMLIGATGFLFDCAKNAWSRALIPSDAPDLTKHPSYNLGVMADPARRLVWAVDTDSRIYVLRLDPASLKKIAPTSMP